jgi:hypothetical protein
VHAAAPPPLERLPFGHAPSRTKEAR